MDPKNFFAQFLVDPQEYFEMYDEYLIEPEVLAQFAAQRSAVVAEVGLAETYGWQVGDMIPLLGTIWTKADGTRNWEFELVGTFSLPDSSRPLMLLQYEYVNESVEERMKDATGRWTVRLSDPDQADNVAAAIDQFFENSANPVRTVTEDEASRQMATQLGDIGFIVSTIMAAVFFTILLLTGNTMAQSLRERIPELAVLKTLGFTDSAVSLIVLAEGVTLSLVGGLLGIVLSSVVISGIRPLLEGVIGSFSITAATVAWVLGAAVALGLLVGSVPALTARRLAIVDALRRG